MYKFKLRLVIEDELMLSQYRWKRRITQFAMLLLVCMIPALGLFRIDLVTASFYIMDHQIWWSNFFFVFGLAVIVATAPIITFMTIGSVWCGWACPQNLLSEWANNLTYKLLGKRADVSVDGEGLKVAVAKNKIFNWLLLGTIFMGAAVLLALIPFLFFYSVGEVWSIVSFSSGAKLSKFMQRLYFLAVFLVFIDIAVVRYFMCDYACLYRIGQRMFKTRDALHVTYDTSRSSSCAKCNYCATSCITGIQPTKIEIYDSCIDCGECIDACNRLQAKSGLSGLLRFQVGEKRSNTTWLEKLRKMSSRFNRPVGGFFLLGCVMLVWGIMTQPPPLIQVSLAEQQKMQQTGRVCNVQCAQQQLSCRSGSLEGCSRAAACKCECYLQQDPDNPASNEWRQCVQSSKVSAEILKLKHQ
jgi:polyferredoxin